VKQGGTRTIGKRLMLLEVGLGTDGEVLEGVAALRELVQMWAGMVQPDDKEADAVRTPALLLRFHLGL